MDEVIGVRSAGTAAALPGAGLGVALAPGSAVDGGLSTRRLHPPLSRVVVEVHRSPVQPVVAAFCDAVVRTVLFEAPQARPPTGAR